MDSGGGSSNYDAIVSLLVKAKTLETEKVFKRVTAFQAPEIELSL